MQLLKQKIKVIVGAAVLATFFLQPAQAADSFAAVGAEVQSWQKQGQPEDEPSLTEEKPSNIHKEVGKLLAQGEFIIIDKKNGKVTHLVVPVGGSQQLESIIINLHSCWQEKLKRYRRSNIALLEIFNFQDNKVAEQKFYGWMFSKNPELSYLSHERYDVMLKQCVE